MMKYWMALTRRKSFEQDGFRKAEMGNIEDDEAEAGSLFSRMNLRNGRRLA